MSSLSYDGPNGSRWTPLVLAAVWLLMVGWSIGTAQSLDVERNEAGYLVRDGDRPVLQYHRPSGDFPVWNERTHFFHPLYGLEGQVLTENAPDDHIHHRGIFWAWHQNLVNGRSVGDSWSLEDFRWRVRDVETVRYDDGTVGLQLRVNWGSPRYTNDDGDLVPFVREDVLVRVHSLSEHGRAIDFTIGLAALADEVRLGGADNQKGYGGFSIRIKRPSELSLVSTRGPVEAQRTPVTNVGPWMNFIGPFGPGGDEAGIAVFSHMSNPNHPPSWILRQSASMQNVVYPGREPVVVPGPDQPVTLRYRVLVHDGTVTPSELDGVQEQYNEIELVQVP